MTRWGSWVVVVVVACGGASTRDPSGSGGAGGTSGAGFGGVGGGGASGGAGGIVVGGSGGTSGQPSSCPPAVASPGTSCALPGVLCEYDGVECWCTDQGWACAVDTSPGLGPCSQPGAVCENTWYDCQCGMGGQWLCAGGGEDVPPPQQLPPYIAEGGYCGADWTCVPEPPCGPKCSCESKQFECAEAVACVDQPCPVDPPQGTCSLLGKTCQYTGFCAPACRCMLQANGSQNWECLTPPC